jgi:hypothetical protein
VIAKRICSGFGEVRCVCCVFWVVGDEMFICGQGTGIYAATKAKADTVYGVFGGEFSMGSVCVWV